MMPCLPVNEPSTGSRYLHHVTTMMMVMLMVTMVVTTTIMGEPQW
jgi:hypothetical protein